MPNSGPPPRQEKKQMDTIVTPGLVLKETRYKESDRIITLLTPRLGIISASAQSSLRLKSKLFGRQTSKMSFTASRPPSRG